MSKTVPRPSQRTHMPPTRVKVLVRVVLAPRSIVIPPLPRTEGVLKENALAEPAEEDAQHRIGVGGGADRGAHVDTHPLLIDDDRGRQPLENVDLGTCQ